MCKFPNTKIPQSTVSGSYATYTCMPILHIVSMCVYCMCECTWMYVHVCMCVCIYISTRTCMYIRNDEECVPVGYFWSKISSWRSGSCTSPASTTVLMPTMCQRYTHTPTYNNKLSTVYMFMRLPPTRPPPSTCTLSVQSTNIIKKKKSPQFARQISLSCSVAEPVHVGGVTNSQSQHAH